jgi:hypothetical protein
MNRLVPITSRRNFDLTDLLSLTGMIALGYVLLTFGPTL